MVHSIQINTHENKESNHNGLHASYHGRIVLDRKYWHHGTSPTDIICAINQARQTIYNVLNWFKTGQSIQAYYNRYKAIKQQCGAKKIQLSSQDTTYIQEKG